jgi:5'-3' exonuclease
MTQLYDIILIDALNLLYRLRDEANVSKKLKISSKAVYRDLAISYISFINELKQTYMTPDASLFLLYDPIPHSYEISSAYRNQRQQISSSYKSTRKKDSKEFYNTFDLLRYYYLAGPEWIYSAQRQATEADDLVKPVIKNYASDNHKILMITNDKDWTRYLSTNVDWMPKLKEISTAKDFEQKEGYVPSENSVVLYKALLGDISDNIPPVLAPKYKSKVVEWIREGATLDKILQESLSHSTVIEQEIQKNQRQIEINYQLISAVDIEDREINAVVSQGRNSIAIKNSVDLLLGLKAPSKSFIFGDMLLAK